MVRRNGKSIGKVGPRVRPANPQGPGQAAGQLGDAERLVRGQGHLQGHPLRLGHPGAGEFGTIRA